MEWNCVLWFGFGCYETNQPMRKMVVEAEMQLRSIPDLWVWISSIGTRLGVSKNR